jgi:hypothetical protein
LERLIRVGVLFAVVGVAIQTSIHTLNAALDGGHYFSVNGEGNPITWGHSAVIFAGAFVCTLHATTLTLRRLEWVAMAVILAFLSFDEMLIVHERVVEGVLDVLNVPIVWDSVVWPVLYLPVLGVLVLLLVGVARSVPGRVGRLVLVGLGFLAAAVSAEVLSAPISTGGDSWLHSVEGAVEEGAEFAGWILITTGLTAITVIGLLASSQEGLVRRVTEAVVRDVDPSTAERARVRV